MAIKGWINVTDRGGEVVPLAVAWVQFVLSAPRGESGPESKAKIILSGEALFVRETATEVALLIAEALK